MITQHVVNRLLHCLGIIFTVCKADSSAEENIKGLRRRPERLTDAGPQARPHGSRSVRDGNSSTSCHSRRSGCLHGTNGSRQED